VELKKKGGCPDDHLGIKNRIKKIPVNVRMGYGKNGTVKLLEITYLDKTIPCKF
jgi:hypothetical protein